MSRNNINDITPEVALDFLSHVLPFKDLDRDSLLKFARKCTIDFFPQGTMIFRQGETPVDSCT